jgi:predicted MFS family arabinose efflux permease
LTLYPSVNYLVKERHFGTAYGLIEAFCNVGLLIGSLLMGSILNTNFGWSEDEIVDLK